MEIKFNEWVTNGEINNDKLSTKEINNKLIEEVVEVIESQCIFDNEPNEKNLIEALSEILDVMQLLINRLRRLRLIAKQELINFEGCFLTARAIHEMKRRNRGWKCGDYTYNFRREAENKG